MQNTVFTVVGAGMGGTLVSILLAQKGFKVELYESRDDIRKTPPNSDRSINQSLSIRGLSVLKKAGLWDELSKLTLIEKGRTVHPLSKDPFFSPYGRNDKEIQYSFNRNSFNCKLLDLVSRKQNITLHFNMKCVSVNRANKKITFKNYETGKLVEREYQILIDASGINSIIRQELEESAITHTIKKQLNWGYKSLYVASDNKYLKSLNNDTFHIWPREDASLFAIPNVDGSFVFTIILPNKTLDSLKSEIELKNLLVKNFAEVENLFPVFIDQFFTNKTGRFECIYTSKWHDQSLVLLGDAAHAIMPFYSQGASATFEDCLALVESIAANPQSPENAFLRYQNLRKENTDVLTDLSHKRFYELNDGFRSDKSLAKDKIETLISRVLPFYAPLYTFIAHTTIPYKKAYNRYLWQWKISRMMGLDLAILIFENIYKLNSIFSASNKYKTEYA